MAWIRELAEHAEEPSDRMELSEEQLARADALFQELARKTVAAGSSPEASRAHVRLQDAFRAIGRLATLPEETWRRWGRLVSNPGHESDDHDPDADEDDDDDWEEEPEPLTRVKAVLPGAPARDGTRVTLIQCFDGGLVASWERVREIPERLQGESLDALHDHFRRTDRDDFPIIEDDAGTLYDTHGGGGGSWTYRGSYFDERTLTFLPGVPPEATQLTLLLAAGRFDFDVAGVGERPGV